MYTQRNLVDIAPTRNSDWMYQNTGKSNWTYYYVFHDRVTLFFADNFSTECQINVKFLHNFF